MSKLDEAMLVLTAFGLPSVARGLPAAYTLLALADLAEDTPWSAARAVPRRLTDISTFLAQRYNKVYAENTRESLRKNALHYFEPARIVDRNQDEPGRATNSGKTNYVLTNEALKVLQAFGSPTFETEAAQFRQIQANLQATYEAARNVHRVPLVLPGGRSLSLSPGEHNRLQVAVVNEFAPRFAPSAELLYLGDSTEKLLVFEDERLQELGITLTEHDKLPDVILYSAARSWLYLVEAFTSRGPVDTRRRQQLEQMLQAVNQRRIYVTAFLDFKTFRQQVANIAWETEVWVADNPDHLIHFDGDRFLTSE